MKKQGLTETEKFPKITVVTVVYNLIENEREQYFRQCLVSVHKQSYPNIEHIVIDGASNDGTIDLLEEYNKKGWIKYYSEPDKGIYDAMNKGAEKASGKYVIFLNSDDFFHNEFALALSVEKLEKEKADFSCGTSRIINNEEPVALRCPQIEFFMLLTPFCHQTVLMRRDVFIKEHGFRFNKYRVVADHDLIIRMILKGYRLSIVNEVLVSYRLGGVSSQQPNETKALQQEYFSKMIESNQETERYRLDVKELRKLVLTVCENVKNALLRLNYQKKSGFIEIKIRKYWHPITKIYRILGIPFFSINRLNLPEHYSRKNYRFLSLKLFEKKTTPTEKQYRVLYLPILTIKYLG